MISRESFTIAVSGTHGKTTTATMLAHILQKSGKNITAFLGGISRNYDTNLLLAEKGNILVLEADEYDRSFLEIHPDIAVITSIDEDHLDTYEDENDLHLAFKHFALQVKKNGLLLIEKSIDIDFPVDQSVVKMTYSANAKADYFADNIRFHNGEMIFDMTLPNSDIKCKIDFDKSQKDISLSMLGVHNVSNSVAASSVASYLGLSGYDISYGLATFKGINRRFEIHINTDKIIYIDDYAHHPYEVNATIGATKQFFPERDLTVVFQPHLFSRTLDFAADFAASLSVADELVLLDIYPAREKPISGVDSQMLSDLCTNSMKEVCSKDELLLVLENKKIDVLLTLGAGDIGTLVEPIKHLLN